MNTNIHTNDVFKDIFGGRCNISSSSSLSLSSSLLVYIRFGFLIILFLDCDVSFGSVLRSLVTSAKVSLRLALSKSSEII